jgi:DNA polymerase-3 subunit gamma/tau
MLSTAAFNALLKTLEEPPAFVKFIFATTNIEKLPPTILSRCQRFDLHRVSQEELASHISGVAQKEHYTLQPDAAQLLARAAEGSVRDALSLLDRALTLSQNQAVSKENVQLMLGLTGDAEIFNLFDHALNARTHDLLSNARRLFMTGAQPQQILKDFLRIIHHLTLLAVGTQSLEQNAPEQDDPHNDYYQKWNQQLDIPRLSRLWSIIIRGLEDLQKAPDAMEALDMILMRIVFAAPLTHTSTPASTPASNPSPEPHEGKNPQDQNLQKTHIPQDSIAKDVSQAFPLSTALPPTTSENP